MNSTEFRKQLVKIMPGYAWTVHRSHNPGGYISATGIQSSGFNRLSTLWVCRRERDEKVEYEAKSSGYGTRAPWLSTQKGLTLAGTLRCLQLHYEAMASTYRGHATSLQVGRKQKS